MTGHVVEDVQIEKLRMNPLNSRMVFEGIEDLGRELAAGQVQPLAVFPSEVEGDYTLLDGHRRLQAARRVGLSTLRCEIRTTVPSRTEQLAYIHSAGSTGEQLRESERAELVQDMLCEGMTVEQVSERLQKPADYVRSRSFLADTRVSLKAKVDSGQVDALSLLELDAALDEFTAPEQADQLFEAAERGDLPWVLGKLRTARDLPAKIQAAEADLESHGAAEAPVYVTYSSDWKGTRAMASGPERKMTTAEHVAAGHQYRIDRSAGLVDWYWRKPEKATAGGESSEVIPQAEAEERAAQIAAAQAAAEQADKARRARTRELEQGLAVADDVRAVWLVEKFKEKSPLPALAAHRILVDTVVAMCVDDRLSVDVFAELLQLPMDDDADDPYEQWANRARNALSRKSWAWIAAAMQHAKDHDGLSIPRLYMWNPASEEYSSRIRSLQEDYGYPLTQAEKDAIDHFQPAATGADDVVEACTDCQQSVVGGEGWDGLCGDCADHAESVRAEAVDA